MLFLRNGCPVDRGHVLHSNWPTIPQLYVNGEFIGGCDIVTSMHQNGELAEVLEEVATGTTEN